MTLNATVLANIVGTYTRPRGVVGAITAYAFDFRVSKVFTDGLGADQADLIYRTPDEGVSIALSSSITLDLAGPLVDAAGDLTEFRHIKTVLIYARPENVNDVLVGADTNPWAGWFSAPTTQTAAVPPGGVLLHTHPSTGWVVTPGTADRLKIANGGAGTAVVADIIILGTST